ncbi:MAG: shikimate kinase [Acholeplasmatales bacterium]|jgi:shikimate kinase|nr:shikimate kinase [Acholeplasmatales bacterium]
MRIYLIGMMGSGKSTLGKELSKRLGYKFIDMDHYIEEKCCKFIDEIFRDYGEEWFRAFETNTLKEFLEMDDVIIATGGGVIKNKKHKKLMDGKCIYLSVPVEILEERLAFDDTRPLLKTRSVRSILEERIPLYEYFSDLTVENIDMNQAIDKIMEALK